MAPVLPGRDLHGNGYPRPVLRRTVLVVVAVALAVVMVVGAVVVGTLVWHRFHRTPLDDALHRVPASSLRVSFTDWAVVRRTLGAHLGASPSDSKIEAFMQKAYDTDFSAASSINDSAVAMQDNYGFSPANAQWETYAQGRKGATMVLKPADGTDFGVLADNLRTIGYRKPKTDDGVWRGGVDLVAQLDPTLTPEMQYVVLLKDQGLVVTSDREAYAVQAAAVAKGDGKSLASTGKVDGLDDTLGRPANAMLWSGDFACEDLAMSQADQDSQTQADDLVQKAGGVTPVERPGDGDVGQPDPAGGRGVRDLRGGAAQPPPAGRSWPSVTRWVAAAPSPTTSGSPGRGPPAPPSCSTCGPGRRAGSSSPPSTTAR